MVSPENWAGEPTLTEFSNGFRLITQKRNHYPGIVIQVDVAVGSADFRCEDKEIPHAIEHIVADSFPDTSPVKFAELTSRAALTANATTSRHITSYYFEFPPETLNLILRHLQFALFRAEFDEEVLDKTKQALKQEYGMNRQYRPHFDDDMTEWSIAHQFFAAVGGELMRYCGNRIRIDSLTLPELIEVYQEFYNPSYMSMAVVGMFDVDQVNQWAEKKIGSLPSPEAVKPTAQLPLPSPRDNWIANGEFPYAMLIHRTNGRSDPQYEAFKFLTHLIDQEAYQQLRIEQGVAYTPQAYLITNQHYGYFVIESDSAKEKEQNTIKGLKKVLKGFAESPIPAREFRSLKRSFLWERVFELETNTALAKKYLRTYPAGSEEQYADQYGQVTPEQIQALAKHLLSSGKLITLIQTNAVD